MFHVGFRASPSLLSRAARIPSGLSPRLLQEAPTFLALTHKLRKPSVRHSSGRSMRTDLGVDPVSMLLDSFYSMVFFGTAGVVLAGGYILYVTGSLEKLADELAVESNKTLVETYGLDMTPRAGTVAHAIANPPPSLLTQAAAYLVDFEGKYILERERYANLPQRDLMENIEYWNSILSVKAAEAGLYLIDLVPKDPLPPLPSSYKSTGTHVQIQYQITGMAASHTDPASALEENVIEAIKNPLQAARSLGAPAHTSSRAGRFINATVSTNLLYKGKDEGWNVENIVIDFPNGRREYPYGFERQLVPAGPRERRGWFF